MQFVRPMPFQEAVDKLGSRSPIGSALNSEQWADVPLALRERAFFSSTIESVRFLQRARDAITDFLTGATETLPDGSTVLKVGSRAGFVRQLSEFALAEGMRPLDPEDQGTLKDITSQTRLNLIFDVQQEAADSYGYWKQGMDPDVLDEFPAQRFIREQEVKQPRPLHQQNEGVVELKTNLEFWLGMNSPVIGGFGVPWGPWGFGSGMGVEDVDRAESEGLGLLDPGETVEPVEQDFNDKLQASVQGLDADMVSTLKDAFGDQVDFQDGAAVWSGVPSQGLEAEPEPVPVGAVLKHEDYWQFGSIDASKEWADTKLKPILDAMSDQEKAALADYQQSSTALNRALYKSVPLTAEQQRQVANLDAALENVKTTQGLMVFRGLRADLIEKYAVKFAAGEPVASGGYLSTSLSRSAADSFEQGGLLVIRLPAGSPALYMDEIDGEHGIEVEMLIKRGARLKLLSVSNTQRLKIVEAELIL